MQCSVARTLDVIGDHWSLLIIRDAFYGLRRFDDFQRDLGIARNILSDRLNRLVDHGVLERHLYEERPPRHEYRLTDKGGDLLPVILAMMTWGDRWEADDGPPVTLTHVSCGHVTRPRVTCSECGEELRTSDLQAHPVRIRGAARLGPSLVPDPSPTVDSDDGRRRG
ncbi:MAG TPA: helix-turn-helix domain-containing protein [Nitriliruptorales bacterium]|nr:helix-turn-helix domain-containing protein [Nitriliruptorales bacterium]